MEPFNNFDRWQQLKTYIEARRDLYELLQEFWQVYTVHPYDRQVPETLAAKVECLGRGSNREVYRISKSCEYELDCGFGKIVLACKVPDIGEDHKFRYADGFFFSEPQRWNKYYLSQCAESNLIALPLLEAQCFEEAAASGKNVPAITGIIAGFGILGTITEDVSQGGKYEVERKDWDHVYVQKENCEKQIVIVDRKKDIPLTSETDYYFHRLQIDRAP